MKGERTSSVVEIASRLRRPFPRFAWRSIEQVGKRQACAQARSESAIEDDKRGFWRPGESFAGLFDENRSDPLAARESAFHPEKGQFVERIHQSELTIEFQPVDDANRLA